MSHCLTPFTKRHKITNEWQTFPCGKCPQCKARRISAWSFRLMQQLKVCEYAEWVTLTYDNQHVPISKNGFMTLRKKDIQDFFKRLRKLTNLKISYYAVGEYGTDNMRPHYHITVFNATKSNIIEAWAFERCKADRCTASVKHPIGNVFFGDINPASIGYTLKYMSKQPKIPMHGRDDRERERSLMSKGLGLNYLTNDMVKWHKADLLNRMYVPIEAGKRIAMPRIYKDRLYTKTDYLYDEDGSPIGSIIGERERIADYNRLINEDLTIEREAEMFAKYGDEWPYMKLQIDQYLFEKMYKDAERGRTL